MKRCRGSLPALNPHLRADLPIDIDPVVVAGIWWRHIPHRGSVYYRPPHPADGRWQRGSVVEAFYFADTEATAWAEWYRWLSENGFRPNQMMPRNLWKWKIRISRVADLRTASQLRRVGLDMPPPSQLSWPPYQSVGEALYMDGWPALISPSAARPDDGQVLCVFRDAERPSGIAPIPPPRIFRNPPVPPTGLRT